VSGVDPLCLVDLGNSRGRTVACPWCESTDTTFVLAARDRITGESGFAVVQCRACELRFTQPRPHDEDMSRYYPSHFYDSLSSTDAVVDSIAHGAERRLILHSVFGYPLGRFGAIAQLSARLATWGTRRDASHVPWIPGGRLLEVGSGRGAGLKEYQGLGWDVVGVEPGARGVQLARAAGFDVRHGDLQSQHFPTHSFDAIVLNHVLEHIPDPRSALTELGRILRPRGWLLIRVPNGASWEARLLRSHWYPWELPRHLTHFSPTTLRRALLETGYDVPRIRTEFRPTTLGQNLQWALRSRFGIHLRPKLAAAALAPFEAVAAWCGRGGNLTALGHPLPGEASASAAD
jgi:SAM-dependent methyltransferase